MAKKWLDKRWLFKRGAMYAAGYNSLSVLFVGRRLIPRQALRIYPLDGLQWPCLGDIIVDEGTMSDAEAAFQDLRLDKVMALDRAMDTPLCQMARDAGFTPLANAKCFEWCRLVLASQHPHIRLAILQRSQEGNSALDWAAMNNNVPLTKFLIEVFYILGVDTTGLDLKGHNLLHILARNGDRSADALEILVSVKTRGSYQKLFPANIRDSEGRLPLHIAAMNDGYEKRVIKALYGTYPEGIHALTNAGETPLHWACQAGKCARLVRGFLRLNATRINARRRDGLTPLHLAAGRGDRQDLSIKLVSIDELEQGRILQLLLDAGADPRLEVRGLPAWRLLPRERRAAYQQFLKPVEDPLPVSMEESNIDSIAAALYNNYDVIRQVVDEEGAELDQQLAQGGGGGGRIDQDEQF